MPPSKTINGLLQTHKRLKAVDFGAYSIRIVCPSSTRGLSTNGLDSIEPNAKRKVHSRGKQRQSEQILRISGVEKELHFDHEGVQVRKNCAQESFSSDSEENGSLGLTKDSQMQLSPQQVMVIETNKSLARAKRNQKICEERVAESRAKGKPFPKLEDLLVERTWLDALPDELQKPYMQKLSEFLTQEARGRVPIYPPPALVFNALNTCPFDNVKVVIIGQDPYHGPGQAMGLSFSVPKGIKIPSSLINIFKEIRQDVGCSLPSHGNLERWSTQGVLLLNTALTVREHQANSHAKKGWEPFTDAVIHAISLKKSAVIFLLWGNSAQEKIRLINTSKHHILKAAHPSGLSAQRGFFNCRHFSQTNKILEQLGLLPVDWQI